MTQEDKELLLKDLNARLPYEVFLKIGEYSDYTLQGIDYSDINKPLIVRCNESYFECSIEVVRPYLRPMSSMTRAEVLEYISLKESIVASDDITYFFETYKSIDWLNKKMFDYRKDDEGKTMIEKGLALEAPEGMYKEWISIRGNLKEDKEGNIVGGLKL